jgi:hypothetical protein
MEAPSRGSAQIRRGSAAMVATTASGSTGVSSWGTIAKWRVASIGATDAGSMC